MNTSFKSEIPSAPLMFLFSKSVAFTNIGSGKNGHNNSRINNDSRIQPLPGFYCVETKELDSLPPEQLIFL